MLALPEGARALVEVDGRLYALRSTPSAPWVLLLHICQETNGRQGGCTIQYRDTFFLTAVGGAEDNTLYHHFVSGRRVVSLEQSLER